MQFPVHIAFKVLALAPQMLVTDGGGRTLGYVRQKLLKFIEDVTVYSDETQTTAIYSIKADRVIDFSACYHFADAGGRPLGHVQREGMKSLWRAQYMIVLDDQPFLRAQEEKPLVRVLDALLDGIPFAGLVSGLLLNPTYLLTHSDGSPALRITKRRALLETGFSIDQLGSLDERERECAMLAAMMIILLERERG